MTENGRGAWTRIGKDNDTAWYSRVRGKPLDGSAPEKGFNYEAVHLGVKSIEKRLNDIGFNLVEDGTYGRKVRRAVRSFQSRNGLSVDGQVGSTTGPALWRDHIASVGLPFKFPTKYVWGVMRAESNGDPGAVGWSTPGDRGLYQFNTSLGTVSKEHAHDFEASTDLMFARFLNAWNEYDRKGKELRINCSILQHKSPVSADKWFATGEPPNDVSVDYVSRVRAFSETW